AGDPKRVELVAELLEEPRLVSSNRGFPVYTGGYKGEQYTIACHGIGGPSSAIVFEELRMLGAKIMVRLGTAGSLSKDIKEGDIVIPNVACFHIGSGTISAYAPGIIPPNAPTYEVLVELVREAVNRFDKIWIGPVVSSDAFYAEDEEFINKWTRVGVIAVEMECATLFTLGHIRNFKTAAILIITDNLIRRSRVKGEEIREKILKTAETILESMKRIKTVKQQLETNHSY
ncbi:MAG: purine-nucleoside phosphorylase, partial [Nitrososphaerota archaeon]